MASSEPPGRHRSSTGSPYLAVGLLRAPDWSGRTAPHLGEVPCSRPSYEPSLRDLTPAQPGNETKVCSQPPIHSGRIGAPWAPTHQPQAPASVAVLRRRRGLSIAEVGRRAKLHPFRPHGRPNCDAGHVAPLSLSPERPGGKLRSACDPCPLQARTEPPGRHHSSTGFSYARPEGTSP
jgi:hypothetical protein